MKLSRLLCDMIRILNVAEKNDAAKTIASIVSKGHSQMREGLSKFNKIYEFDLNLFNSNCRMVMTSVSGHLLGMDFTGAYKGWEKCDPVELFSAPVTKFCPEDYENIKRTLAREVRNCSKLIIWTDCDREGENIGFEVIQVCREVRPNLDIYRARFSEMTPAALRRALSNLDRPNQNISDAVDARMELDLRIGAAFTRFQTLRLRRMFERLPQDLISYGSCQFPTLGFVVERYKDRENFVPEPFWKIGVAHKTDTQSVEFNWERVRLFDYNICLAYFNMIQANPLAKVVDVATKPKSKWRPAALDTIELEKSASRKLKINAKETMHIAEKLYQQGLISYPRTETNIFPKELNLCGLIENQCNDPQWGDFAQRIAASPSPRNGNKSDQAHPPIHPTKYSNSLTGNDKRIYEFIVRHFLACCSSDAKGFETTVQIEINEEKFSASGLMITERNYLEVYPYDKWSDKEIPVYEKGSTFTPTSIELKESKTEAPKLLTEADLISLMEKHGIGTDATHAEHIETIKKREYVRVNNQNLFEPNPLGLGLCEGYDSMGYAMSKPRLRSDLEKDLQAVCDGKKRKEDVLSAQIEAYRQVFIGASRNVEKLDQALSQYFGQPNQVVNDAPATQFQKPVFDCPQCQASMVVRSKKDGSAFYLGCRSYPDCRGSLWFPSSIKEVSATDEDCPTCLPKHVKKLKFKLEKTPSNFSYPSNYVTCLLCDTGFCQANEIDLERMKRSGAPSTSTYQSQGYNSSRVQVQSNSARVQSTTTSRTITTQSRPQNNSSSNNSPFTNISNRPNFDSSNRQNNSDAMNTSNPIVCECNANASLKTVRKEGPNQGRQFYTCSSGGCSFFLWSDAQTNDTPSNNSFSSSRNNYSNLPKRNYNNTSTYQNSGAKSRTNNSDTENARKRKCGVCGEEGHNKKNCPNK